MVQHSNLTHGTQALQLLAHDTRRSLPLLETAAAMLAPYAAVLYKFEQATTAKLMLRQMLPPRVVDAAIERINQGGFGAADPFAGINQQLPLS